MTKTQRELVSAAAESFNKHYAGIWGEDRWHNSLYPALESPTRYACLLNRHVPIADGENRIRESQAQNVPIIFPLIENEAASSTNGSSLLPNVFTRAPPSSDREKDSVPDDPFPPPAKTANGLLSHWNLDAASLLVVHLLDVSPGEHVLDLCAAPGGKSIALAQRLFPHYHADDSAVRQAALRSRQMQGGSLHSNEADPGRHRRLAENLRAYIPAALFDAQQIVPLRVDGAKPGVESALRVRTARPGGGGTVAAGFDKVLVDAPCSSERHLIHAQARAMASGRGFAADGLASWRPGSSKRLAKTQVDLLMTGLRAARVGGRVMYATCSIDDVENDGVVAKVLAMVEKERKKGATWNVAINLRPDNGEDRMKSDLEAWAERTKYGWIVLPDHPSGGKWGPLFFTLFTKVAG